MPQQYICTNITKLHLRLNELIEKKNYDLTSAEVLEYSRRLDRIILRYSRLKAKSGKAAVNS